MFGKFSDESAMHRTVRPEKFTEHRVETETGAGVVNGENEKGVLVIHITPEFCSPLLAINFFHDIGAPLWKFCDQPQRSAHIFAQVLVHLAHKICVEKLV